MCKQTKTERVQKEGYVPRHDEVVCFRAPMEIERARGGNVLLILTCLALIGHALVTVLLFQELRSRLRFLLWGMVVWLLPILGPILYVLLGDPHMTVRQCLTMLLALAAFVLVVVCLVALTPAHP